MHCGNPHFVGQILNWFLPFDVWWRFAPDLDVEESLSALVRLLVLQFAHALGHLQLLQGWNYYFSIRAHSIRESAQTLEMIALIRSNNKISHRMAIALKQTVAVVAQWVVQRDHDRKFCASWSALWKKKSWQLLGAPILLQDWNKS